MSVREDLREIFLFKKADFEQLRDAYVLTLVNSPEEKLAIKNIENAVEAITNNKFTTLSDKEIRRILRAPVAEALIKLRKLTAEDKDPDGKLYQLLMNSKYDSEEETLAITMITELYGHKDR